MQTSYFWGYSSQKRIDLHQNKTKVILRQFASNWFYQRKCEEIVREETSIACDGEVFMGFIVTRLVWKREILAQYFLIIIQHCFQILQANKRHAHIPEYTTPCPRPPTWTYTHILYDLQTIGPYNDHSELAQNTIPGQQFCHLIGQQSNRRHPHPKTPDHVDWPRDRSKCIMSTFCLYT